MRGLWGRPQRPFGDGSHVLAPVEDADHFGYTHRDGRPGVTTDINVSYFSAARADEVVLIKAEVLKTGKTMAYVSVDLLRERDGVRIAQGRMSKFLS